MNLGLLPEEKEIEPKKPKSEEVKNRSEGQHYNQQKMDKSVSEKSTNFHEEWAFIHGLQMLLLELHRLIVCLDDLIVAQDEVALLGGSINRLWNVD